MCPQEWIKHISRLSSFNDRESIIDGFNHLKTIFNDHSKVDEIAETLTNIRKAITHSDGYNIMTEIIMWYWSAPMLRATRIYRNSVPEFARN